MGVTGIASRSDVRHADLVAWVMAGASSRMGRRVAVQQLWRSDDRIGAPGVRRPLASGRKRRREPTGVAARFDGIGEIGREATSFA